MNARCGTVATGPWFVQPGFLTIYTVDPLNAGLTTVLAHVDRAHLPKAEAANIARLIGAAPTMLAALERALPLLEPGEWAPSEEWDAAELDVRLAIAQARGVRP